MFGGLLNIGLAMIMIPACTVVGERGLLEEGEGSGESCAVRVTRTEIDYAADVRPLFDSHGCMRCHGGTAGVELRGLPDSVSIGKTTGGPVIVPCDPEESSLFGKISSACDPPFKAKMPIGGARFTAEETSIVQQWITEGANATFDPATCVTLPSP